MSDNSSRDSDDEYDLDFFRKNVSINPFQLKNDIRKGFDQQKMRKRCSSAAIKIPKNFAPKLRPKKSFMCPSPIILDQKPPPKLIQEIQNTSMSTLSFESKNEFKKIRIKVKDSFKYINEKVYANSDNEDDNKKEKSDSETDSSKNEEINNNQIKLRSAKKRYDIKSMRGRMTVIRKNSLIDNVAKDDTSLVKYSKKNYIDIFRKIQKNFINKFRTNKNMRVYPLNSAKYRNKSHTARYPTILGFLERNKSTVSLNSVGK
jgi:hypothetical protein